MVSLLKIPVFNVVNIDKKAALSSRFLSVFDILRLAPAGECLETENGNEKKNS